MHDHVQHFRQQLEDVAVDKCSISIQYVGYESGRELPHLWLASVYVGPLPLVEDDQFILRCGKLLAGRIVLNDQPKAVLLNLASDAEKGILRTASVSLQMEGSHNTTPAAHLEATPASHQTWAHQPLLVARGPSFLPKLDGLKLEGIDTLLRTCDRPFDGLADLLTTLGFPAWQVGSAPRLTIQIGPSVDLDLPQCRLADGCLNIHLKAGINFPVERVHLAVVALRAGRQPVRRQVGDGIAWTFESDLRRGSITIDLSETSTALVMLLSDRTLVRRQFYFDWTKSGNPRLLPIRLFDADLRRLRDKLAPSIRDGRDLEPAVAQLAFLLGFNGCVQLEKDAPDIVATTPSGRVLIVECTVRTSDIHLKVGKLVSRRQLLIDAMRVAGSLQPVLAVLVVAQSRESIALHGSIRSEGVVLVTSAEIDEGLRQLDTTGQPDPEALYDAALQSLNQADP